MKFTNHDLAESVCVKLGLEPIYHDVDATEIDVAKSRQNRARPVSVNKDAVEEYSEAMKRGDVFPAIVVAKIGNQKQYVIAGGNHRHEAAMQNGCKTFRSIVVRCNETEFDALCKALNAVEGQRLDRKMRVDQAVDLVRVRGLDIKYACDALQVSRTAVQAKLRASDVRVTAAKMGITIPLAVANTSLEQISQDTKSEPLFKAVASFVAKRIPSVDEVKEMNSVISSCKSEATKIAAVQKLYESSEPKSGNTAKVVARPIRTQTLKIVTQLETLVEGRVERCNLQLDEHEGKEVLVRCEVAMKKLRSIRMNG
jgi:uncharacterized ParB-like nuclease family protein